MELSDWSWIKYGIPYQIRLVTYFADTIQVAHWIAVATMSNILEIALAIFPVILVWDLRMPRVRKTLIAIGMWSRLPYVLLMVHTT